jgi:adenylate cyclase class 2
MVEIEVKIKISDIEETVSKITQLGAHLHKERQFETNTLYDFPSRSLYQKKQALRIRKINKKTFLTFKGPPQKSRKFKVREEFETEVKNEKKLKQIMKSIGLVPSFKYEKFRSVYRQKKLKICLDETSIGNFLELEGERGEIVRAAKALGFSKKEFIKKDYVQLLQPNNQQDKVESL